MKNYPMTIGGRDIDELTDEDLRMFAKRLGVKPLNMDGVDEPITIARANRQELILMIMNSATNIEIRKESEASGNA